MGELELSPEVPGDGARTVVDIDLAELSAFTSFGVKASHLAVYVSYSSCGFPKLLQYGCSVTTIYRRRREFTETRRCDDEELFCVVQEMEGRHTEGEPVFATVGTRTLKKRLREEHGIVASRSRVGLVRKAVSFES